jgi:hypothetical protein
MEVHMKTRITIEVDIDEIEFHGVDILTSYDKDEAWGQVKYIKTVEAEWDHTTWNGLDCQIVDEDAAVSHLVERSEEGEW